MSVLRDKEVVLCVTGGIAAYKAVELSRRFFKAGARVSVAMTPASTEFVSPLTFQSVLHTPVAIDMFERRESMHIEHVSLARRADVIVVAPATANTLAKMAQGMADNIVTTTLLAARCPVVVAPAMNDGMWVHPATKANMDTLRRRGVVVVPPAVGLLAEGGIGEGRLAELEDIVGATRQALARGGPLAGRRVLITAGSTHEPLDPVRFISNRSSGKMGVALAQAALDRGAAVTLVAGPLQVDPPWGAEVVPAVKVADMQAALACYAPQSDVLIMAAAPVDYRAEAVAEQKLKKEDTGDTWRLTLVRNPDLVGEIGAARPPSLQVLVGFAAETEDLVQHATGKLRAKGLDYIVANDVSAPGSGFEVDTNAVTILGADGDRLDLPLAPKEELAFAILDHVTARLQQADEE